MKATTITVLGVPMDLGAGRRGVDMGPSAIRAAGIHARLVELGYKVEDWGNVEVPQPEGSRVGSKRARFLAEITQTCERLRDQVVRIAEQKKFPLVLGGDHSVGAGTVAGLASHLAGRGQTLGLIWVDAHADMNTPATSPSGNVHGMPLASILGMGPKELTHLAGVVPMVDPRNTVLVGIRDVDAHERPQVKRSGMHAFTMRDIDEHGMMAVMRQALAIAGDGTAGVHLSLDMDSLDPGEAPGVGTPVRGGLSYREAHLAMEMACDSGLLESMEVVEVNPVLDERNRTAQLAVELVTSALGKRIL